jgi:hypothetical protein
VVDADRLDNSIAWVESCSTSVVCKKLFYKT